MFLKKWLSPCFLGYVGAAISMYALFFYNEGFWWGSAYLFSVHAPAIIWASGFLLWWQLVLVGPRELNGLVWVLNIVGASFCQFFLLGRMINWLRGK